MIIARDLDNNIFERSAVQHVTLGVPGDHVLFGTIPLAPCTESSCGDPPPLP